MKAIKLKALITEGSLKKKLPFLNPDKTGKEFIYIQFTIMSHGNRITLIPSTSKDLDNIATLDMSDHEMQINLLDKFLNGGNRLTNIEFIVDDSYKGAGFGYNVNLDKIAKKLKGF